MADEKSKKKTLYGTLPFTNPKLSKAASVLAKQASEAAKKVRARIREAKCQES